MKTKYFIILIILATVLMCVSFLSRLMIPIEVRIPATISGDTSLNESSASTDKENDISDKKRSILQDEPPTPRKDSEGTISSPREAEKIDRKSENVEPTQSDFEFPYIFISTDGKSALSADIEIENWRLFRVPDGTINLSGSNNPVTEIRYPFDLSTHFSSEEMSILPALRNHEISSGRFSSRFDYIVVLPDANGFMTISNLPKTGPRITVTNSSGQTIYSFNGKSIVDMVDSKQPIAFIRVSSVIIPTKIDSIYIVFETTGKDLARNQIAVCVEPRNGCFCILDESSMLSILSSQYDHKADLVKKIISNVNHIDTESVQRLLKSIGR